MNSVIRRCLIGSLVATVMSGPSVADGHPEWTQAHAPYQITDHVYSVGTKGIGVYLIKGAKGLILLDCSPKASAPLIEANIKALGFQLSQVKWILATHAHWDHVGACATIKRDTGAWFAAGAGDQSIYETGKTPVDNIYGFPEIETIPLKRPLKDGDVMRSGRMKMVAIATPGHTPGDLSWTLNDTLKGKGVRIVFFGSASVAGNILIGNKAYPDIVADYRRTSARLKGLKVDLPLGNHTEFLDQDKKLTAVKAGIADAFIDPKGYYEMVDGFAKAFEAELIKQEATHHDPR